MLEVHYRWKTLLGTGICPSLARSHEVAPVKVVVHETVGRLQRIESANGGELQEGAKVVVDGAHYVTAQDKVTPVGEITASP